MKKSNLFCILFYNLVWLFISYQWCYIFIRKVRTPAIFFWLLYALIYIGFTIGFIVLLKYIKNPIILSALGLIVSLFVSTLAVTAIGLAIDAPDFIFFMKDYNEVGLFYIFQKDFCLSAGVTLSFLVGLASLLSCYYADLLLQKFSRKKLK